MLKRGYKKDNILSAFNKARRIPREKLLKKVSQKKENKRPVFATPYDPRLPSIPSLQIKHWRSMTNKNKYLAEVFQSPPLTAFKRQPNIRSHLIRAAVAKPQGRYPERIQKGMKRCNDSNCTACPFIREGKNITINGSQWRIDRQVNCSSHNIVYAILCKKEKCNMVYLGETKRQFKFRLADHRGYVINKHTNQATGLHFNLPGHSLGDMSATVIEIVKKNDIIYRKEREEYHIRRFNTLNKGLNRKI